MKLKLLSLILFLCMGLQGLAQLGNKHYFPPIHSNNAGPIEAGQIGIYLSTPSPTAFNVTIKDAGGTILTTLPISQDRPALYIPSNSMIVVDVNDLHRVHSNKGFIVEGSDFFYASMRYRREQHAGYMTAKGESALGTSFRVGYARLPNSNSDTYGFYTGIMASEDNTTVTFSDYNTSVEFRRGAATVTDDSFSISLNEGESFALAGYGNISANHTGFIGASIISDKPIVVNTGNANGTMDINGTQGGSDYMIDQIVEIPALGTDPTDFIVIAGNGMNAGTPGQPNTFRERPMILATQDNTEIRINGNTTPITTLNAGEHYLIEESEYAPAGAYFHMFIQTSQPAYCYQFLAGSNQHWTGGMNFIPPLSCFFQRSVDLIPWVNRVGTNTSYSGEVMIVAETGSTVTVNGAPAGTPRAVPGTSTWESYRVPVAGNNHAAIVSTGPMAAGIYGHSGSAGFAGYYSGFAVNPSDTDIDICSNDDQVDLFPLINGNPPPGGTWTPTLSGGPGIFVPGTDTPGVYNYSILSACATVDVDITVSVTPSPFSGIPNNIDECDTDNDGFFTFDLTVNETLILGANPAANHTVSYHTSGADAVSNTAPIGAPAAFLNTTIDQQRIYARLEENGNTSCADTVSFLINVFDTPTANTVQDWAVCDSDNDGVSTWDLTTRDAEVLGGQSASVYEINYYDADPAGGATAITDPVNYQNTTNNPLTIWAEIRNIANNTCFDTTSFEIEVFDTPTANTVQDWAVCDSDNDGVSTWDLTTRDAEVLGGQSASVYEINYYDADPAGGATAITDPVNYQNTTNNPLTIWAEIRNIANNTCFDTTSFEIEVFDTPTANTVQDWAVCDSDNDGVSTWDLTTRDAEVLGGQSASVYEINYYDADPAGGATAITDPVNYQNTTNNPLTIWAEIRNIANNTCFDTTSFEIEVFDTPTANTVQDWAVCDSDNDGVSTWDLTTRDAEVLGGQSTSVYEINYYDADPAGGATAITDPVNYQNTTNNPQTIWAEIRNIANNTCFDTTSFEIEVFNTPTANTVQDWAVCDSDNDGVSTWDLTTRDAEVLGGQSTSVYEINYYDADPAGGATAIADPMNYQNTTNNPLTIWAEIRNIANNTCFDTTSFEIEVFNTPTANTVQDWAVCDSDNDGVSTWDLTTRDAEVLGGQSTSVYEINYYDADPADGATAIADPMNYQNTTNNPLTIWAEIRNIANNTCFDTTTYSIEVFNTPNAIDVPIKVPTCSATANADFDLTLVEAAVANNVPGLDVAFFEDMALTLPITNPANYNTGSTTVFARVSDPAQNNCFDVAEVALEILLEPEQIDLPLATCATSTDNLSGEFDLESLRDPIINNAQDVTVSFHTSMADADSPTNGGVSPITNTTAFTSTSGTIFARSEANYNGNICHTVSRITLTVNGRPVANNITFPLCAETPTTDFDLNSRILAITGGGPRDVHFFDNMADATNNNLAAELTSPYNSGNTTVYARVENTNTNCVEIGTVTLEVIQRPTVSGRFNITECLMNGISTFDLATQRTTLEASYPNYTFTFHETQADADAGINAVADVYPSTARELIIRIEVTGAGTDCIETETLTLNVAETPITEVEAIFCAGDGYTLPDGTITNMPGDYTHTLQDVNTGCDYTIETKLTLGEVGFVSAFTPNGNGQNDLFGALPSRECAGFVDEYHLQIWDRWGEKVFETTDYGEGWNGVFNGYAAPGGVYLYKVEYTFQGEMFDIDGTVTLIR